LGSASHERKRRKFFYMARIIIKRVNGRIDAEYYHIPPRFVEKNNFGLLRLKKLV
jgi:hypothetical protein